VDETFEALAAKQARLASRVVLSSAVLPAEPTVLALDVQYGRNLGHVAGSLWRGSDELGTWVGTLRVSVDYVPGYFCFREGPPLLALVERLSAEGTPTPDLLIVDGHGIAHPRKFGVACWLGLACGIPTLGCAKESLLPNANDPDPPRGSDVAIVLEGEQVGWGLRMQDGVNPVFASPGHLISLGDARERILSLPGSYRIPDPQRRADHACRMQCKGMLTEEDGEALGTLQEATPPWDV
jgi:deoxyribonuclease V